MRSHLAAMTVVSAAALVVHATQIVESDCQDASVDLGTIEMAKDSEEFRDYDLAAESVRQSYQRQRQYQTHAFATNATARYCQFGDEGRVNTVWELFDMLKGFVDLSDPDINLSNHQHLFQTAEAIRKDGRPDWMQFVGLVHDLGKVLHLKGGNDVEGTSMSTQWAIVGDTFITGCAIPDVVPFPEYNSLNPDSHDPVLNTTHGVYEAGSGFRNAMPSFGHDEYLYQMFKHNNIQIPEEGMYMIRYHSCYPWHDRGEYTWLEDAHDKAMKPSVQAFNKYDLYSKVDTPLDEDQMRRYYDPIVQKYAPDPIEW